MIAPLPQLGLRDWPYWRGVKSPTPRQAQPWIQHGNSKTQRFVANKK